MVLRQDPVHQSSRHSPITIFTRRSLISRSLPHNHSGMVLRQDLLIPTIFTPQSFSMVLRQDLDQQYSRHSPITIFTRRSLHQSFVIPLSLATVLGKTWSSVLQRCFFLSFFTPHSFAGSGQDLLSVTLLFIFIGPILYPSFFRHTPTFICGSVWETDLQHSIVCRSPACAINLSTSSLCRHRSGVAPWTVECRESGGLEEDWGQLLT
jgi:hypothetical protein